MSLLQKASIITTPTAYAEDYLYSIKPAYALGSELVTNGDFSTDSDWAEDGGAAAWSISGGKANCVVNASTRFLNQTNALPAAGALKTYQVIYTISNYVQGALRISVGGYNSTPARLANGTYTEILQVTNPSSNKSIYLQANPNTIGSIDNLSVKEITDADFDFDRNSTGTRVNEDYLIEDVPYNLASYSENISVWDNFRVDVELSNVLNPFKSGYVYLVDDGTVTDNHYRKKSYIYLDSSYTYTQSFFVKKKDDGVYPVLRTSGVGGNSFVTFNWDTETLVQGSDITSSKVEKYNYGWYRISMVFSNLATTDFIIGISNDVNDDLPTYTGSNKGFYVWGCQIVKGDQPKDYLKTTDRLDIPRIDYTNGEPSILLEPSRTNDILNNTNLSQWLIGAGITVTSNAVNSPEGIQNADKIEKTSQNYTYVRQNLGTGNVSVFSIFVKQGNYRYIGIRNNDSGHSVFDFETKSFVTSLSDHNLSVQQFPNGWFRLIDERTISTNTNGLRGIALTLANGTELHSDIPLNAFAYVWGGQLENNQTYATSLIHTSGSAVTRSADAANNAGNSDLINSTEGVLYAEIKALADDSTYRQITLSDGTITNRIGIFYQNTSNQIGVESSGTGTNLGIYNQNLTITNVNKIALKYKANDCALWINGTQVATDTSFTAFSSETLSQINFDKGDGSSDFYGNVKSVMVFKEALTDLELEKLTGYNNHELYMNYYNRLSYLGLAEEYNVESDINNYIL